MIADSCSSRIKRDRPAALTYLDSIGVALDRVRVISVSHWHQDHAYRIAELARACPSASVAVSEAMAGVDFLQWVGLNDVRGTAGLAELFRDHRSRVVRATQNSIMFRRTGAPLECEVLALSPSGEATRQACESLLELLPEVAAGRLDEPPRRAIPPNRTSIVHWISVGQVSVLLGGDLENENGASLGWNAIFARNVTTPSRASIYKVAHHGSENADNDGIWNHLLEANPAALVAPYKSGSTPLPREADVTRLCGRTPTAAITSTRTIPANPSMQVRRTLSEAGIRLSPAQFEPGMLRARGPADGTGAVRIELGEAAALLCA
jgi:hypothetical protein